MIDPPRPLLQRYFDEVALCEVPTKEQEIKWFAEYVRLSDDNSKKKRLKGTIVEGYLRFVIKKANDRTNNDQVLPDLISVGNIGLVKAVDKFDPKYKVRFLTYAAWWIEVEMQGFLNSRQVHVPHQTIKDQRQIKRREDREMALGVRSQYSFTEVTTTTIDKVVVAAPEPEEDLAPSPTTIMRHLIDAGLDSRQRLVLTFYFGLRGGTARTLEEISNLLFEVEGAYLTREKVRELKEGAVTQLGTYLQEKGFDNVWEI